MVLNLKHQVCLPFIVLLFCTVKLSCCHEIGTGSNVKVLQVDNNQNFLIPDSKQNRQQPLCPDPFPRHPAVRIPSNGMTEDYPRCTGLCVNYVCNQPGDLYCRCRFNTGVNTANVPEAECQRSCGPYRRRKREIVLYNLVLFICGAVSMFSLSHAYAEHRLVLPWAVLALFIMFAITTMCQWSMHNMQMREEEASLRPVVLAPVVIPTQQELEAQFQQLPFHIQNGHSNSNREGESDLNITIIPSSGLPKYEDPPNYSEAMKDTIVIEGNTTK